MGANILIVDDSATMRRMIRRTLSISGLDIQATFEAQDGLQALSRLASHAVDVIILDINMPRMNGLKLLQRMRVDPRLKSMPVVVASTEGSETRLAELQKIGAIGYIRKPFSPEQLRSVLEPIIGVSPSPTTATEMEDDAF